MDLDKLLAESEKGCFEGDFVDYSDAVFDYALEKRKVSPKDFLETPNFSLSYLRGKFNSNTPPSRCVEDLL